MYNSYMTKNISVPDIGDFKDVEIIEILVKTGDKIKKDDPIVTLESDKSSVEVPSPFEGKISELKVKIGDRVSEGSILATLEGNDGKNEDKNIKSNKIIAFTNHTHTYHLGTHKWYFINAQCTDEGESWRKMSLYRKLTKANFVAEMLCA